MIAVRMMQVAVDQVVDMVAVRHRFVPASWSVDMPRLMPAAVVSGRTLVRIIRADLKPVLVYVIGMWMVQMPIMQIIDVIVVPDSGMATIRAVLMIVIRVVCFVTGAHVDSPRGALGTFFFGLGLGRSDRVNTLLGSVTT
jgi:hypothetical protein